MKNSGRKFSFSFTTLTSIIFHFNTELFHPILWQWRLSTAGEIILIDKVLKGFLESKSVCQLISCHTCSYSAHFISYSISPQRWCSCFYCNFKCPYEGHRSELILCYVMRLVLYFSVFSLLIFCFSSWHICPFLFPPVICLEMRFLYLVSFPVILLLYFIFFYRVTSSCQSWSNKHNNIRPGEEQDKMRWQTDAALLLHQGWAARLRGAQTPCWCRCSLAASSSPYPHSSCQTRWPE